MTISPPPTIHSPVKRLKGESPMEYVIRCGLDPIHTDIIFSIYEQRNLKSFEVAVAHVIAMFSAIQDLFYFHETPIEIPPFTIKVNETITTKAVKKRCRQLDVNSKSFLTKCKQLVSGQHVRLNKLYVYYQANPSKFFRDSMRGFMAGEELKTARKKKREFNEYMRQYMVKWRMANKNKVYGKNQKDH